VVRELDPARVYRTRADYFADPEQLQRFIDGIDRMVLAENGLWRWLRTLVWPRRED
jgi:hypothetical protein